MGRGLMPGWSKVGKVSVRDDAQYLKPVERKRTKDSVKWLRLELLWDMFSRRAERAVSVR